jgi:hypothetical protein
MSNLVDSASSKYAVIETLRTEARRECIVIAYPDEQSLRALLAAPSIIALGFVSRDNAEASIENCCR